MSELTTKEAIERCHNKHFDDPSECKLAENVQKDRQALGIVLRAAEERVALGLAHEYADRAKGCWGCPAIEACHEGTESTGGYAKQICSTPYKHMDTWIKAARKEGRL